MKFSARRNFSPILTKSPKLYFYDTGLLCWLLGIQESAQLATHPLRGGIFETFVVSELMKTRFNRGERPAFHFWRDSNGNKVDIVVDIGTKLMPIKIKSGATGFFYRTRALHGLGKRPGYRPSGWSIAAPSHVCTGMNVFRWDSARKLLGPYIDINMMAWYFSIMIKTQVQLPDDLYREVKRIAREREMSLAEVMRRGLEYMVHIYPPLQQPSQEWSPPKPRHLGNFVASPDDWREMANMPTSETEQI